MAHADLWLQLWQHQHIVIGSFAKLSAVLLWMPSTLVAELTWTRFGSESLKNSVPCHAGQPFSRSTGSSSDNAAFRFTIIPYGSPKSLRFCRSDVQHVSGRFARQRILRCFYTTGWKAKSPSYLIQVLYLAELVLFEDSSRLFSVFGTLPIRISEYIIYLDILILGSTFWYPLEYSVPVIHDISHANLCFFHFICW